MNDVETILASDPVVWWQFDRLREEAGGGEP